MIRILVFWGLYWVPLFWETANCCRNEVCCASRSCSPFPSCSTSRVIAFASRYVVQRNVMKRGLSMRAAINVSDLNCYEPSKDRKIAGCLRIRIHTHVDTSCAATFGHVPTCWHLATGDSPLWVNECSLSISGDEAHTSVLFFAPPCNCWYGIYLRMVRTLLRPHVP